MKTEQQRRLAAIGGLSGAAYLAANNLLPGVPDFIMGLLVGLALVFLVLGLLPEARLEKLRKWKNRG